MDSNAKDDANGKHGGGKPPTEVHFFLDGEPEVTQQSALTPNQIIIDYGHKLPNGFYLVKIQGSHQTDNYQGHGDDPIALHNGDHFQMIAIGPTPLSDQRSRTGIAASSRG